VSDPGRDARALGRLLCELGRPIEAEPLLAEGLRIAAAHEDAEERGRLETLLESCRAMLAGREDG
jgi:hypothetical protein